MTVKTISTQINPIKITKSLDSEEIKLLEESLFQAANNSTSNTATSLSNHKAHTANIKQAISTKKSVDEFKVGNRTRNIRKDKHLLENKRSQEDFRINYTTVSVSSGLVLGSVPAATIATSITEHASLMAAGGITIIAGAFVSSIVFLGLKLVYHNTKTQEQKANPNLIKSH